METLNSHQASALEIIRASGGVLDYQSSLYGFAAPGAARNERIVMQTAKALIARGFVVATRIKTDNRGRELIDQISIASKE